MFKIQQGFNNSFFGSYAYGPIINRHQNHVLVRLNTLIDWSFVEEETVDCLPDEQKGRTENGAIRRAVNERI